MMAAPTRQAAIAGFALLVIAHASAARAQDGAPSPSGPLVIERIHDTFVVAPEYKVTSIDHETGQLAGLSAGRVMDEKLLVGGAVYWLANNSRDFKLTYGGLVVGWSASAGSRLRFGARGLAGVGSATLGSNITLLSGASGVGVPGRRDDLVRFGRRGPSVPGGAIRVLARDDFAVVEPQGDLLLRITDRIGIGVSAGYRFTGFEDALRDRLDGATGSVAVQLGW
jgi:hypothetical protein